MNSIWNSLYVQADHPLVTATQIADHEAFHAKANRNGAEMIDRLSDRIASMDRDAFDRVVGQYGKVLEAIYDTSDYDAFMRIVAEEMLADAYSGINAFGAHAEQFGDTVNQWMDEHFMGKKSEAEMEQLRGPPEGQRFSVDDYDYQDFSWAVNDGILSPLELRKVESAVAETVAQGYNSHSFNDALSIATIDGTKAALFRGSMEQPVIDYVIQCDTGIDQDEILLVKEYIDYARDGEPKRILESLYDEQGIRIFDRGNRGFLERETGGREGDIGQTSNQGYQGRENQVSNAKRRYGPTQAEVDESLERMRATIREEEAKQNFSVDDAMDSDGNRLTAQQAEYFADSKIRDEDGTITKKDNTEIVESQSTPSVAKRISSLEDSIDQDEKTVKQNFSVDDVEYLRLAENPAQNYDRLNEMVRQAAEDAGYNRMFYHGAKNGGYASDTLSMIADFMCRLGG